MEMLGHWHTGIHKVSLQQSIKNDGMRKYIYTGVIMLIVALSLQLYMERESRKSMEQKWMDATENVNSYSELFSSSSNSNRTFKLSIEQLESSKDSIFQELCKAKDELKVKNSKLQSFYYMASSYSKADTITLTDTLFRDPQVKIDTLVSDEWYSMRLSMKYPSTIMVEPEFRSERSVVVSMKKETVDPPKKFFLLRWFQKKHYVLNVDVIEKNPYVKNTNNRYVEIIK